MRRTLLLIYVVAVASMIGWTFVWPLTVSADPGNSLLRIGCLATLVVFLLTLAGLLWTRPGLPAAGAGPER